MSFALNLKLFRIFKVQVANKFLCNLSLTKRHRLESHDSISRTIYPIEMIHSHINFYSNSSSNGFAKPITLGGSELTPGLIDIKGDGIEEGEGSGDKRDRSSVEKHVEIVEYLKRIPKGIRATFIDFQQELKINLNEDINVLGMMRSNPKIDVETAPDGTMSFSYRSKFEIKNKRELLLTILRVANGIVLKDIIDCYEGIESDVNSLIIGGEIIANKNKEIKSLVLYPRGISFLSRLSGTVTATQGKQLIDTSVSLLPEIRRGEAIQVDEVWYRVSSAIGSGAAHQQNQRSTAPTSVTSDRDMSDKNVYCDPYTEHVLPLDGDFEGHEGAASSEAAGNNSETVVFKGSAFKHGCTNDIKDCWRDTIEGGFRQFQGGQEKALEMELIRLNLLSKNLLNNAQTADSLKRKANQTGSGSGGANGKKRQVRKSKPGGAVLGANSSTNFGVNAHLRGTALEKILRETREKEEGAAQK